ncbi:MAG: hypothetical protein GY820_16095 [Gammaproteobacteria bacterium]|nr:hypothetical protein [Gammaproteobacteria bacterium]
MLARTAWCFFLIPQALVAFSSNQISACSVYLAPRGSMGCHRHGNAEPPTLQGRITDRASGAGAPGPMDPGGPGGAQQQSRYRCRC